MNVMMPPAVMTALGMLRRAFLTSSPMNDAASRPLNPNARVDQKTMSSIPWGLGTIAASVKWVAGPNLIHAVSPMATRIIAGSQVPSDPLALWSHLPMLRPTRFRVRARASPLTETMTTKVLLSARYEYRGIMYAELLAA